MPVIRVLTLLLVLLPALPAAAKTVADLARETQIYALFATQEQLRPLGLTVEADEGRVTLSGSVPSRADRELAGRVAASVEGVAAIDNRLQVDAARDPGPTDLQPSRRSLRQWFGDAGLLARIKTRLLLTDLTDAFDINVDVNRGRVRLQGAVDHPATREAALRIARQLAPGRDVQPRIELRPRDPVGGASRSLAFDDLWITARVKSSLLASREVDGLAIGVATTQGKVSLSGRVDSSAEHAAAVALAREVRGVREVQAAALRPG